MRQILVTLLAASMVLAITPTISLAAPCKYGSVNGVCIEGKKSLPRASDNQYVVKKCIFKWRCDYKVFVKGK